MLAILIASDHKPLRETLGSIVLSQPLFHLAAVCADPHAAMCIAAAENPHIILIDGSTDPLAVIEATKKIVSCSNAGVIALSRYPDAGFAQHMIAAGALGYITHSTPSQEIIMAVQEVAKDNVYLCRELSVQQQPSPVPTPAAMGWSFPEKFIRLCRGIPAIHWHRILRFTN